LQNLLVNSSDCLHHPLSPHTVKDREGSLCYRQPDVANCGGNLITGMTSAASPRVDVWSTCKVGEKLGVSLPLFTCSPSAWPCRLLYRRGRKSRRALWIILYYAMKLN
jgi:hypothetical protein